MNTVSFSGQNIAPSKIICVGRNYADHAKELNNAVPSEPVIFLKPNSAIRHELTSHPIQTIHFETEIALLMEHGRVVGAGIGLDLTKRELQTKLKTQGLPWEKSKAFDGSAVFTPFIPVESYHHLGLSLHINGELRQKGHVNGMLFSPEEVIQDITSYMTLCDGDIIMTGTPKGVGSVHQGDVFEATLFTTESGQEHTLVEHQWVATSHPNS